MSDNTRPSTDLLADFRKILELFDRENQIYKNQISILKDAVTTLQTNEDKLIDNMSRELKELRNVINGLNMDTTSNSVIASSLPNSEPGRVINDYLCQICLDTPRDCLLEPCMHFCICTGCVKKIFDNQKLFSLSYFSYYLTLKRELILLSSNHLTINGISRSIFLKLLYPVISLILKLEPCVFCTSAESLDLFLTFIL
jgi:hypothetical protein